jgi:hypothetical protein
VMILMIYRLLTLLEVIPRVLVYHLNEEEAYDRRECAFRPTI